MAGALVIQTHFLVYNCYITFIAGKIPDEQAALQMAPSAVAGMIPGQPTWPSNVISQVIKHCSI